MSGDAEVDGGVGDFGSEPRWRDLGDSRDLAAAVRSTYQPATPLPVATGQAQSVAIDEPPAAVAVEEPPYVPPPLTSDPLAALRESVSARRRRPTLPGRSVLAAAAAAGLLLVAVGAGLPRTLLGGVEPTETVEPIDEAPDAPASHGREEGGTITETPAWTYAPPTETSSPALEPRSGTAASAPTSSARADQRPVPKRASAAGVTTTTSPTKAQSPPPTSSTNTTNAPATNAPSQEPPPEDEDVPEGGGW